jgi:hypothetical protein
MSNREMINYLREEINEKRYVILYLASLKAKMECLEDSSVIQKEIDRLSDSLEEIKKDYDFYLEKSIEEDGIND